MKPHDVQFQNRPTVRPPITHIDRRNCRRVVPMEVLVLGLCRYIPP